MEDDTSGIGIAIRVLYDTVINLHLRIQNSLVSARHEHGRQCCRRSFLEEVADVESAGHLTYRRCTATYRPIH